MICVQLTLFPIANVFLSCVRKNTFSQSSDNQPEVRRQNAAHRNIQCGPWPDSKILRKYRLKPHHVWVYLLYMRPKKSFYIILFKCPAPKVTFDLEKKKILVQPSNLTWKLYPLDLGSKLVMWGSGTNHCSPEWPTVPKLSVYKGRCFTKVGKMYF